MVKEVLNEKGILNELDILNEIKQEWSKFSEFVKLVDRVFLKTHFKITKGYMNVKDFKNLREDVTKLTIFKRNYESDDYRKLVDDFKHIIDKYPFDEMLANYDIGIQFISKDTIEVLKYVKESKKALSDYMNFVERKISKMNDCIIAIKNMGTDANGLYDKGAVQNILFYHSVKLDSYDVGILMHVSNFIQEIDALIKITTQNIKNYELAKQICVAKKLDLTADGLLFHFTSDNIWHASSIVKFVKEGLKPSVFLDRHNTVNFYPNMVCFTLSCGTERILNRGSIVFVLNPNYVSSRSHDFYYNPNRPIGSQKNEPDFIILCQKLGFSEKPDYLRYTKEGNKDDEWPNEVQTRDAVPFSAIAAIIVSEKLTYRMQFFMSKLCHREPELTVPIYNHSGELIWPL